MRPSITIEYCSQCGWMLRASYTAQELLTTFTANIRSVNLQPAEVSGTYIIYINEEIIFDRKMAGRFPEIKELKQLVRDKVCPQKSLGHSDKTSAGGNKENLLGVVLCGGESRRMGSDKGLLPIGESIWALSVAGKLAPFGIPVIFSVNDKQLESYSTYISPDHLVIDSVDVKGPLKGLLSVHKKLPGRNLLLLACDMLNLDEPAIQKMISAYQEEKQYDFFVYQDLEFAQPFCGIYTSQGLAKEYALSQQHDLQDFSLQSMLNKGKTRRLEIAHAESFRNYNSL